MLFFWQLFFVLNNCAQLIVSCYKVNKYSSQHHTEYFPQLNLYIFHVSLLYLILLFFLKGSLIKVHLFTTNHLNLPGLNKW